MALLGTIVFIVYIYLLIKTFILGQILLFAIVAVLGLFVLNVFNN